MSIADFEQRFTHAICNYNFQPGALVLVLNKKIEAASNAKCKPRYFGPMVVVSCSTGGSYHLAELDSLVSRLKFTTFRIVPYHPHSSSTLEVTQFINRDNLNGTVPKSD
jgi:hypothetical protein